MKILFGGSFDPIHIGHLTLIKEVIKKYSPDSFVIVPAYQSIRKPNHIFDAEFRRKLINKAIMDLPKSIMTCIEISDFEILQKRAVYTYETIEALKPDTMLIGGDLNYTKWKYFNEVIDKSIHHVLIFPRNNVPVNSYSSKDIILDLPESKVSSSEIIKRLLLRKSITGLVPDSILENIEQKYFENSFDPIGEKIQYSLVEINS
jgi:nicotinate-nucleotide adenylyltransferase